MLLIVAAAAVAVAIAGIVGARGSVAFGIANAVPDPIARTPVRARTGYGGIGGGDLGACVASEGFKGAEQCADHKKCPQIREKEDGGDEVHRTDNARENGGGDAQSAGTAIVWGRALGGAPSDKAKNGAENVEGE